MSTLVVGPCRCGGYGIVYTEAAGRCHDPLPAAEAPAICATQSACRQIEAEASRRGLSAYELSRRTGISRSHICRIFNGASVPDGAGAVSLEVIERLAQAMGLAVHVTVC